MRPSGAHTHPGHGGGIGGAAAAAALVLMVVAAFARPLLHLVDALAEVLRVLLIAAAITLGTAVAALAGFMAWKLRRPRRPAPWTATVLPPHRPAPTVASRPRPELGGRAAEIHLHLHGLTPEQAAEAIARHAHQAIWPGQEGDRS